MAMKTDADFFKVWGGISGVPAFARAALRSRSADTDESRELPRKMLPTAFGLAGVKGRIEPGSDADLVLVDPGHPDDGHDRIRCTIATGTARISAARFAAA